VITDAIQKGMSLRSIGSDANKGLLQNLYKLVLIEAGGLGVEKSGLLSEPFPADFRHRVLPAVGHLSQRLNLLRRELLLAPALSVSGPGRGEAGQGPLELGQVSANYFLLDTCGILE
jgi:hypothetical protein